MLALRRCPEWDSNPHLTVFETTPLPLGYQGAAQRNGEQPDDNLPDDGTLVG